jgi:chromate transporter
VKATKKTRKKRAPSAPAETSSSALEVLRVFTKLGLTSFGGPVAHIGYFREEFVERRRWLTEHSFADLVALCQFLPGPASSQFGMAMGLARAGYPGVLAAWVGFTLPSALLMVLFAYGVSALGDTAGAGWLQGLKVAAVAVVARAVFGMMQTLAPDRERATVAVVAAGIALAFPSAAGQIGAIVLGAIAGFLIFRNAAPQQHGVLPVKVGRPVALGALALFFALLIGLPLAAATGASQALSYFDAFYRAGSLIFGGGHVVLPLLKAEVVAPGWLSEDAFLAGYGAAQAIPGPLLSFAAYLGAVMIPEPNGWLGAVICLVAIFLPSFLLVVGVLPFWQQVRRHTVAQAALLGVNAAVVGIMLAALYDPIWTAGITSRADFALAILAFLLLYLWRTPPWLVVLLCALAGGAIGAIVPAS